MATDPRTIDSYNQFATTYHEHVSDSSDSIYHSYYEKPALRSELGDLTGKNVLCIGCGSGVDANWLLQNGAANVTGIDISKELIAIGQLQFPGVSLHVMDMEKLDLPDNSYDIACSSLAIHYIDDMTTALKEVRRVLKTGGRYVFSCGHPFDTAIEKTEDEESKTRILGRTVIKETDEQIIHGDYLVSGTNGTKNIDGNLGDMEVRIYHRTFGAMIQQIVASGFTIEKLIEPQPLPTLRDIDKRTFQQLTKLPAFAIWVVRK